jgi:hypothetical protein
VNPISTLHVILQSDEPHRSPEQCLISSHAVSRWAEHQPPAEIVYRYIATGELPAFESVATGHPHTIPIMDHHQRYPSSQPPSFTVTPDVPSPAGSYDISVLPPISAGASVDYDSDMENENEDEPEEEVDQLVSDPEDLPPPQVKIALEEELEDVEPTETEINVSSIRKLRSGKIERIPGHTLLPQSRLESIMVADGQFESPFPLAPL